MSVHRTVVGPLSADSLPEVISYVREKEDVMLAVWVVESGEYENSGPDFVASSLEAAVERLRAIYAFPYVVEWSELGENDRGGFYVDALFEAVPDYSTKHQAHYDITEHQVY